MVRFLWQLSWLKVCWFYLGISLFLMVFRSVPLQAARGSSRFGVAEMKPVGVVGLLGNPQELEQDVPHLIVPRVVPTPAGRQTGDEWLYSMEGSIATVSSKNLGRSGESSADSLRNVIGWLMALLLPLFVILIQTKYRRHTHFVFRSGERDYLIFTHPGKGLGL